MLKNKIIRKIFTTTLFLFIIMFSYTLKNMNKEIEPVIDYVNIKTNYKVYLKDKYNRLAINNVYADNIDKLISMLYGNNIPKGLKSPLRKNFKILKLLKDKDTVKVYVNEVPERIELESISYTLFSVENVKKILFYVNNSFYTETEKDLGINRRYDISEKENIKKASIYYKENIEGSSYFVPVTKYVNNKNDKIDIIIEELTSSFIHENNLISTITESKINNYTFDNNILFVEFNDYINKKDLESLTLSVFENYNDLTEIIYTSKGKILDSVKNVKK